MRCSLFVVSALVGWLSINAFAHADETVRGVVKSQARIDIVSELSAPVAEIPVRTGEAFSAGDTLIAFDCGRFDAELRAAKASAVAAEADHKQKRYLFRNGAGGRSDMEIAAAQAEKARADIAVVRSRMEGCTITAPFDGRVVELTTQPAERPPTGEPLMTVINSASLEVEMVVPSVWLRTVERGTPFEFVADETGTRHNARISRIGAEVDPVSQTIVMWADFDDPNQRVLAGMSGNATFDFPTDQLSTGALQ